MRTSKPWLALVSAVTLTACILDRSGVPGVNNSIGGAGGTETVGGGGEGGAGADDVAGTGTGGAGGTGGTGGAGGTGGVGGVAGPGGAGGDVTSAGGAAVGGMGGAPPAPTSCIGVAGPSGLYTVDPDGAGGAAPFEAYCEQELADGGWTLIARSEAGGTGNMGWGVNRGVVTGTAPYSLAPVTAGLPLDMLLVVSRENGIQAYTINLPPNFVADHTQSGLSTNSNVSYVTGACMPSGGTPSMLNHVGHTDKQNLFFFRDLGTDNLDFGLFADGFSLHYTQCNNGGGMHSYQGELYVR